MQLVTTVSEAARALPVAKKSAADFFATGGARAASDTVVTSSSAAAQTDLFGLSPFCQTTKCN